MLQLAHTHLLLLRWNEITNIPGAGSQTTTQVFAWLLSDEWINDMLIDMMFSHLSEHVEEDSMLDSFFMQAINKASSENDHNKPLTLFLHHLENRNQKGKFNTLIFPAHLGQENYWLAFKIDFEHGELSYGMPPPKGIVKKLQWWLWKCFRGPFKDCGDFLEHGHQEDSTKCGIITPNTAAREVFHDELWRQDQKAVEHVNWFQ
ncbi:hypothetical protein L208DRAFT_1424582 [Tricholoma matsutake]|nr:hypothetical protein L208DRAFT_1424582 [Tricholoma matsutake 945]